ncbi:hypothetical protein VTO73DRAFT_1273 [Trametes versicolor]
MSLVGVHLWQDASVAASLADTQRRHGLRPQSVSHTALALSLQTIAPRSRSASLTQTRQSRRSVAPPRVCQAHEAARLPSSPSRLHSIHSASWSSAHSVQQPVPIAPVPSTGCQYWQSLSRTVPYPARPLRHPHTLAEIHFSPSITTPPVRAGQRDGLHIVHTALSGLPSLPAPTLPPSSPPPQTLGRRSVSPQADARLRTTPPRASFVRIDACTLLRAPLALPPYRSYLRVRNLLHPTAAMIDLLQYSPDRNRA